MDHRLGAAALVLAGLLLGACQEYNLEGRLVTDEFTQEPASLVDILFVVDNSVSMEEEQDEVADNFSKFIASIEETNAEWQIGVVTTDMVDPAHRGRLVGSPRIIDHQTADYEAAFQENIRVGTEGYPIERGLSAALAAVTPPLATHDNAGFVREDAQLAIIVVSDENDCSDDGSIIGDDADACYQQAESLLPISFFASELRALKDDPRDVTFSAVVELDPDSGAAACGEAAPGYRYLKLASLMGGMSRSICGEYDDIMDELGLSVAGIRSSFQLTRTPDVCSIEAKVDGVLVERDDTRSDGWTFDPDTNYLTFWGPAIPPRDATLVVTYESGDGNPDCQQ